ncbi:2Fe-2S iron-sulfur cluster-binding protein [Gordonia terrae]
MKYQVTVVGKGDFPVEDGQSVLESALRANQWLPHACSQGTCGTCKIRVLHGEIDHGEASNEVLTESERHAGIALACQSRARGDVTISPLDDSASEGPMHPLRDHQGTVIELAEIARCTRRLVIELDEEMEFSAGQYAELIVPGSGAARQYSMANPPSEPRRLEFHVRLAEGGAATEGWIFHSLRVGDRVALRGPYGRFAVAQLHSERAIMIGGGTGLAPLKSMVRHALSHDLLPGIDLYHGGRCRDDLYDVDFFRELEASDSRFRYHPVLSDEDWDGATGLVTDAVIADFPSCKGYRGYLCGPPAMVIAGVKALKRRRMAPRLVAKEEFTIQSTEGKAPAPA